MLGRLAQFEGVLVARANEDVVFVHFIPPKDEGLVVVVFLPMLAPPQCNPKLQRARPTHKIKIRFCNLKLKHS